MFLFISIINKNNNTKIVFIWHIFTRIAAQAALQQINKNNILSNKSNETFLKTGRKLSQ